MRVKSSKYSTDCRGAGNLGISSYLDSCVSDGFLGLLGAGGHWMVVGKGLDRVAAHSADVARHGESSGESFSLECYFYSHISVACQAN